MAQKPRIKGVPPVTKYSALVSLSNFVEYGLTTNIVPFPTPSPTVIALAAARAKVEADIALWGPVGGRGTHENLMTLRADALTLRNLLVQEQGYVLSTVIAAGGTYADQSLLIVDSGFGVKNAPTPQGLLGVPRNLHQFFKNGISIYHVGLKWKGPLGLTSPGNVKNYQIYRGTTSSFTDVTTSVIGTSTKTLFIDHAPITGSPSYYWITASNSAGIGAPTAFVAVNAILH